jgi:ClpP class serine protease
LPREPLRLTRSLLAAYRPGSLICVGEGLAAGIPAKRPTGYLLHASASTGRLRAESGSSRRSPAAPERATAVIAVRGVLEQRAGLWSCGETGGYDEIGERFDAAAFDPGVGSLVIDADSPGGDDPGIEAFIARCQATKAATGKPVLGFVNELAASAMCWILAGVCDAIYLPRSGRIGSIAQVVVHQTEARALADSGVDTYVARGLPGKMDPNGLEVLSELGKARLDELAAAATERFIEQMVAFRGLDAATIRTWNGGMFTGQAAIDVGLADGLGSLEQTIALAGQLAALQEAP